MSLGNAFCYPHNVPHLKHVKVEITDTTMYMKVLSLVYQKYIKPQFRKKINTETSGTIQYKDTFCYRIRIVF